MTPLSRSGLAPARDSRRGGGGAALARVAAVAVPIACCACACLLAAGCLYIEAINHPPVAVIDVVGGGADRAQKCQPVLFDGGASSDPEDGADIGFQWNLYLLDDQGGMRPPFANEAELQSDVPGKATVLPLVAGRFAVTLQTVDRHGAMSEAAQRLFTVADAPPQAMIDLDGSVASGCGDFAAGGRIGIAARKDIDPDLSCPADPAQYAAEALSFRWSLTVPPGSTMAGLGDGPCSAADVQQGAVALTQDAKDQSAGEVCLAPDVPGTYTLTALVDDGAPRSAQLQATDGQTASFQVQVAGDRPPCLVVANADPPPASYIDGRGDAPLFQVREVKDDLDGFPATATTRFSWSLWHESDPVWRPLPNWDLDYLQIDSLDYAVDEQVMVRVAAGDRVARDLSACDPNGAICSYQTAYPTAQDCFGTLACAAWVTWEVRFR